MALFDLLVNNADRKGSHVLVEKDTNKLWVIDHGLCFHEEEKLRTVIWDFAGEPIPADLLNCLATFPALLGPTSSLRAALRPFLSAREVSALGTRAKNLLNMKRFPAPPRTGAHILILRFSLGLPRFHHWIFDYQVSREFYEPLQALSGRLWKCSAAPWRAF